MRTFHSDFPLGNDESGRFLPWISAFIVYFAVLTLAGAMAMYPMVERWSRGLAGQLTVQVQVPDAGRSEAIVDRVLKLLSETPGVTSTAIMQDGDVAALLESWLGAGVELQELPLPILITVAVDVDAYPDLRILGQKLNQIAPGSVVDDHKRWLVGLLNFARFAELTAAAVVLLTGALVIVTVSFITRAGLAIHREVVELLHLMGAEDAYIARQFQNHAFKLGLGGGLVGFALAALTVLMMGHLLDKAHNAFLPDLSLSTAHWAILTMLPLAAALIATLTARATVLRTLARML
jgi:cell division transport system permease protein